MVRCAIVDDNKMLRENLVQRLSVNKELELVFTAGNGQHFLDQMAALPLAKHPQVILMDVEMDVMDGITATSLAKEKYPQLNILMLSVFDDDDRVFNAIKAGAAGYLLKEEPAAAIFAAILGAVEGKAYMSPTIARKTLEFIRSGFATEPTNAIKEETNLSKRELEILEMLTHGNTYGKIAEALFLSEYTVQTHIRNIYSKLHVNNKLSAIKVAMDKNWFKI